MADYECMLRRLVPLIRRQYAIDDRLNDYEPADPESIGLEAELDIVDAAIEAELKRAEIELVPATA
jgi:hypothetical protein